MTRSIVFPHAATPRPSHLSTPLCPPAQNSQEKMRAVSEYLQYREIPPTEKLQVTVNHRMI